MNRVKGEKAKYDQTLLLKREREPEGDVPTRKGEWKG